MSSVLSRGVPWSLLFRLTLHPPPSAKVLLLGPSGGGFFFRLGGFSLASSGRFLSLCRFLSLYRTFGLFSSGFFDFFDNLIDSFDGSRGFSSASSGIASTGDSTTGSSTSSTTSSIFSTSFRVLPRMASTFSTTSTGRLASIQLQVLLL